VGPGVGRTPPPDALASATLIKAGVLTGYQWHHRTRIWRAPVLGEDFQATASRPAFRLLLGRENLRLTRGQIDRNYDASRSWSAKRAVLKLYRATAAAALRPPDRPALALCETTDACLPCEQAERQRQAFPSAQVELPGAHDHWVMLEDPGRVASLVIPFSSRQLPGSISGDGPWHRTERKGQPPTSSAATCCHRSLELTCACKIGTNLP